ncbi:hypothetical protein Tco_1165527 [Tanacetum coccineum]
MDSRPSAMFTGCVVVGESYASGYVRRERRRRLDECVSESAVHARLTSKMRAPRVGPDSYTIDRAVFALYEGLWNLLQALTHCEQNALVCCAMSASRSLWFISTLTLPHHSPLDYQRMTYAHCTELPRATHEAFAALGVCAYQRCHACVGEMCHIIDSLASGADVFAQPNIPCRPSTSVFAKSFSNPDSWFKSVKGLPGARLASALRKLVLVPRGAILFPCHIRTTPTIPPLRPLALITAES